ncbi:unnamed protein product [Vitrella brassicaformis CCMP3155]|uniref:Actin-related protein 8 n=1 Tax=Vitrella brassicaformis (strain CCMP3155) TaxID=1169540 RepID=A0A0G4G2P0_VITBC|nr:unnamed protein product [Vitrella brassicaformis CCMP3155]|eukprot:CEM22545.1 unnamed protein product [Vitrella brassicaformis CCMP3155]
MPPQNDYFFSRPMDMGLVTDHALQRALWERVFSKSYLNVDFKDSALLLTEAPQTPRSVTEKTVEVLFEEYGFSRVCLWPAAALVPHYYRKKRGIGGENPCSLVVDCGASSCLAVPVFENEMVPLATRRLDVGGDLLTTHLTNVLMNTQKEKEKQNWLRDKFLISEHVKQSCCFVAEDFVGTMDLAKRELDDARPSISAAGALIHASRTRRFATHLFCEYVLPNAEAGREGYAYIPGRNRQGIPPPPGGPLQPFPPTFSPPSVDSSDRKRKRNKRGPVRRSARERRRRHDDDEEDYDPDEDGDQEEGCGADDMGEESPAAAAAKWCERWPPPDDDETHVLRLNNERILIPEILFRPSDMCLSDKDLKEYKIGPHVQHQWGLPETIQRAIYASPPELQPHLPACILLAGGTTKLPHFKQRLMRDLRPMLPQEWLIEMHHCSEPELCAWRGGSVFATSGDFYPNSMSRREYFEGVEEAKRAAAGARGRGRG